MSGGRPEASPAGVPSGRYGPPDAKTLAVVGRLILATGYTTIAVGIVYLIGGAVGAFGNDPAGSSLTKPTASVCFILAGMTLLLLREPGGMPGIPADLQPKLARWVPISMALLAFVSWLTYAINLDFPGRMASGTAFTFSLLGAAFLIRKKMPRTSFSIVLFFMALIYVILIWYIYAAGSFFGTTLLSSFAVTSVVVFMVLLVGMLLLEVPSGILQVLVADSPAGAVTRRLVPLGISAPPFIGFFGLQGELAGTYDAKVSVALFASALVGLFSVVAVLSARSLNRVEAARISAEQARRASEERFTMVFHSSPVAMTTNELESGRFLDANASAVALMGIQREQMLGKTSVELGWTTTEGRQAVFDRFRAEGRVREVEVPVVAKGEPRRVLLSVEKLQGPEGPYLLSAFVDITERKRMEDALRTSQGELSAKASELSRSNSELEQFAYVASHDLQEPLRMVASYVQLLERRYKGKLDEDADEFIRFAVEGARRMQNLINDLLMYSRVGTRGAPLIPTPSKEALDRALENLQVTIEETGTTIQTGNMPEVVADPTQLTQVFQNLISNAIKYRSKEAPKISIDAERKGQGWQFSVVDNGIGIDPKHFDRIFIIFQRLQARDDTSGTGIGLALCKKIVERHGGKLTVDSAPGKGSTFRFTLPDRRPEQV